MFQVLELDLVSHDIIFIFVYLGPDSGELLSIGTRFSQTIVVKSF